MKRKVLLIGLTLLAAACAKQVVEPPVYTLRAGFDAGDPETRSRLDFTESAAQVLWTGGDAFRMYRIGGTGYSQTTFTTQDDGVTCATFTTSKQLAADDSYTSIYPAASYGVFQKYDDIQLRIPVPSEQAAVPGGIAEGLNFAAAWSDSQTADLSFINLLSVVRFRLSGEAVSSLASVTFEAGTTVAGDAGLYFRNGEVHFDFSSSFSSTVYPRSTSVTLTGPFVEGQDYCIALVPTDLRNGFEMVFRDSQDRTLSKKSFKPLTLNRSRIVDFGTITLDGGSWKRPVIKYMTQSKGSKSNVIAVLADGFTDSQLDLFETLGQQAMDYLFSVEPYKTYRDYFTVYLCPVASNESGAGVTDGDGNILTPVDNYFGSRWGESVYGDMTADASKIQTYLRNNIPEIRSGALSYQSVPTLLLINDTRYGGICHTYGNGWAYCQVPYQHAGRSIRWSFPKYQAVNPRDDSEGARLTTDAERDAMGRHVGDWRNTVLHEFGGHGFGRLTDEYWKETTKYTAPGAIAGHSYAVPYARNASGYYDSVPWKADLLDHLDEWVARNPDYARVGIFHGALTSLYYRWRSEMTSCMIDNRPYFNLWSRILIVRRIMEKAGVTFDMDDFIAKDVTTDPIRPSADASPEELRRMAVRARMVPEMPMLPPPVMHEDE